VSSAEEKYDALADGFSEREYANPARYSAGRARLVVELGPRLERGATVLDLGCGDGIMAEPLLAYGLDYTGVDLSAQMVDAARRRRPEATFVVGRFEDFRPPEPVDATVCLRAIGYPDDRVGFFRGVAGYTKRKFVFDFRQAEHEAAAVERDLRAAGFTRIVMRPYFVPQRRAVPGLAANALEALEHVGPAGLLLTRFVGILFCSASV
jgi:predicted TPR repeat methyltransferase